MEKCISGSYPFCAKNKWFGENNHIGLNRFILLCFSGFKFLREEKEQEASIVSTNIDWLFSMLPGTRLHFLWLFLLLKLLSTMRKKLLDVSLLIPKVAPERPFLLSFFFSFKIIMIQPRGAAGNSICCFSHLEPESCVCVEGAGLS